MSPYQKPILSPFLTIVFAVVSVTGALLFFHIKNGVIVTLHEWLGWAFVAAGCVHLILNFKPLAAYLRTPKGAASLAAALILVVALACVGAHCKDGPGRHGHQETPPSVQTTVATP